MYVSNIVDVLIERDDSYVKKDGDNYRLFIDDVPSEIVTKDFFMKLSAYMKRVENKWIWKK